MKKIVAGLLLTGAFAFAATRTPGEILTPQQEHRLAQYTKDALRTQSPRIHLAKVKNNEVVRPGDQIVRNKTTYTVVIPYGK
jgi:hypothetical protein